MLVISAHAEDDLPIIHNLPCETVCANSTGPVAQDHVLPSYPKYMKDARLEGFVRLNLTITKEGNASDLTTVAVVGPKEMAYVTGEAVKKWTWKPATLDGKPVSINRTVEMTFRMPGEIPGAGEQTIRAYQQARRNVGDGKWSEAKNILDEAQAAPNLNLYERGMLATVAAQIALKEGNFFEAQRLSVFACAHSADVLPPSVILTLWQTRITASVSLGDIVDALNSFDKLKVIKGFDPSSPIVKYVQDAHAKADAMPVFGMSAKIPRVDEADSIELGLYRRTFAFKEIVGSLDKFTLSCKQQAVGSKIADNAEWHVPKSWSECNIEVEGAPGTTFKVVQAR